MKAVILAGGSGTRLRTASDRTPKPMLPLFGKPAMEHSIRLLKKHGVKDILVALSYRAKEVMDYFGDGSKWRVKINYSLEEKPIGTAGAVKRAQSALDETFIVVAGDIVTDLNLSVAVEFHRRSSAIATVLLHEVQDPSDFGVVAAEPDGRVTRYVEKPPPDGIFSSKISTGIYILEPDVLGSIPYEQPCDFGREVFPRLLHNMDPVYACELPGYWCDVGNMIQYRAVHFDALMGKLDMEIGGKEVEKGIYVEKDALIHRSVQLIAPLFIGSGAEVRRNAALGELSVIGADALIDEAAIVERSIIGSGAFIGRASNVSDCVIASGYHLADNDTAHNRLVFDLHDRASEPDEDADIELLEDLPIADRRIKV